ncbi:MAG: hypothetical protein SFX18_10635 [Pirellulales bacterium]|nr:hypothetical protein [Pirellulales bacterium]
MVTATQVETCKTLNKVFVKCRAARGFLGGELGIVIQGVDQSYESFVEPDHVRFADGRIPQNEEEKPGLIEAGIVQVNCDSMLVELPRQVITAGRRVWIPKSEVAE